MDPTRTTSHPAPHVQFELDTKLALEVLGFQVSRDEARSGSQIDLIATFPTPLASTSYLVECKSSRYPIGVKDVRQLYAAVASTSTAASPVYGMLISQVGFTRQAKQQADDLGVVIRSLSDLQRQVFDARAVARQVSDYLRPEILHEKYVPLSCTASEHGIGTIYKPVEAFLDKHMPVSMKPYLVILGDFGTGKTTLSRHYAYKLAQAWVDQSDPLGLPLYVNLRDLADFQQMEASLAHLLRQEYGVSVTEVGMQYWLSHGRTLLILDGLDEMLARLDQRHISRELRLLRVFQSRYRVKIVLTCRTHFFRSHIDEALLGDVVRVYMLKWDTTEIEDYIRRNAGSASDAALSMLKTTYNLEELAQTPIFLKMIAETLGSLEGTVHRTRLYEHYTDRWILGQDYRAAMPPEEKHRFMEELALSMVQSGKPIVPHTHIPKLVRDVMSVQDYDRVRSLEEDVRTCTFLVRNRDGDYRFSHRSFMEFFVARRIAQELKACMPRDGYFVTHELSSEIAAFIANYFDSDTSILFHMLAETESSVILRNVVRILEHVRSTPEVCRRLQEWFESPQDDAVGRLLAGALARHGEWQVLLARSRSQDSLGTHCFSLVVRNRTPRSVALVREQLLREEDVDRAIIALEAVAEFGDDDLRPVLQKFLTRSWWYLADALYDKVFEAITVLWNPGLDQALKRMSEERALPAKLARRISGFGGVERRERFHGRKERGRGGSR